MILLYASAAVGMALIIIAVLFMVWFCVSPEKHWLLEWDTFLMLLFFMVLAGCILLGLSVSFEIKLFGMK